MNNQFTDLGPTLTGLLHKLKMIQAISTNISHTNSIGYQREIPESISFQSVLSETATKDPSRGQFKKTNNTLDLAIEGNAYFLVESKDGPVPTRNGRFHLNEKGELATMDGQEVIVVEKTDKPISLAKEYNNITINKNGEIYIGSERYGRLAMEILDNKPIRIHQGVIEGSNVNIINEMISMQMAFRAFESSEKVLGMEASLDRDIVERYGRNI